MRLDGKRYEELNEEAYDLMEAYGVKRYPVDVFHLAGLMGISLVPYCTLTAKQLEAFIDVSKDAVTIASGRYSVGSTFIAFNEKADKGRLRQSIAHEIGHIWLEHPCGDDPYETEAEYFAAYLLAPIPLLLANGIRDPHEIVVRFHVSMKAAEIACERACNRIRCCKPIYEYEQAIINRCSLAVPDEDSRTWTPSAVAPPKSPAGNAGLLAASISSARRGSDQMAVPAGYGSPFASQAQGQDKEARRPSSLPPRKRVVDLGSSEN